MSPLLSLPSPLSVTETDLSTSILGLEGISKIVGSSSAAVLGSSDVDVTLPVCPGLLAVTLATFITLPLSTAFCSIV